MKLPTRALSVSASVLPSAVSRCRPGRASPCGHGVLAHLLRAAGLDANDLDVGRRRAARHAHEAPQHRRGGPDALDAATFSATDGSKVEPLALVIARSTWPAVAKSVRVNASEIVGSSEPRPKMTETPKTTASVVSSVRSLRPHR